MDSTKSPIMDSTHSPIMDFTHTQQISPTNQLSNTIFNSLLPENRKIMNRQWHSLNQPCPITEALFIGVLSVLIVSQQAS